MSLQVHTEKYFNKRLGPKLEEMVTLRVKMPCQRVQGVGTLNPKP